MDTLGGSGLLGGVWTPVSVSHGGKEEDGEGEITEEVAGGGGGGGRKRASPKQETTCMSLGGSNIHSWHCFLSDHPFPQPKINTAAN